MKAISISGGATKFVALASAVQRLEGMGYRPDVFIGVSSGSIVSYFAANGWISEAVEESLKMSLKTIWSKPPINKKGRLTFTAYWNLIRGKNYFSKMDNLRRMLERYITAESHLKYATSAKLPSVFIMAINARTKGRKVWNLKSVSSHNKVIDILLASSTIPGMGEAVEIDDNFYYDGGLRDQNAGAWLLEESIKWDGRRFREMVSIYSRPRDYRTPPDDSYKKNVVKLLSTFVIDTLNIEISKGDEFAETRLAEDRRIALTQVFINPFVTSLFDTDPDRLYLGFKEGVAAVDRAFNANIKL